MKYLQRPGFHCPWWFLAKLLAKQGHHPRMITRNSNLTTTFLNAPQLLGLEYPRWICLEVVVFLWWPCTSQTVNPLQITCRPPGEIILATLRASTILSLNIFRDFVGLNNLRSNVLHLDLCILSLKRWTFLLSSHSIRGRKLSDLWTSWIYRSFQVRQRYATHGLWPLGLVRTQTVYPSKEEQFKVFRKACQETCHSSIVPAQASIPYMY